jgi:hypothetical protein
MVLHSLMLTLYGGMGFIPLAYVISLITHQHFILVLHYQPIFVVRFGCQRSALVMYRYIVENR